MNIQELKKLPLPKLKEKAKEIDGLEGVGGMKKEELIAAIAKAQGIAYERSGESAAVLSAVKAEIRSVKKKRDELLSASGDARAIKRLRRKIKLLKRQTRGLSRRARAEKTAAAPAESAAPAAAQPG
jgi:hypothetical protein